MPATLSVRPTVSIWHRRPRARARKAGIDYIETVLGAAAEAATSSMQATVRPTVAPLMGGALRGRRHFEQGAAFGAPAVGRATNGATVGRTVPISDRGARAHARRDALALTTIEPPLDMGPHALLGMRPGSG